VKRFAVLIVMMMFLPAAAGYCTEVSLSAVMGKTGQMIEVPVTVDRVAKLAGVKLILTYDAEVLTFKEGNKTPQTQSLMHIVNDKKPGRLTIVMAGARGISGKDVRLMNLIFHVKKGLKNHPKSRIEIIEIQLMGDDLKEIKASSRGCTIITAP